MVERWAMVRDDGYVENVCLWDGNLSNWQPPNDIEMVKAEDQTAIGWIWNGTEFTNPMANINPENQ